MGWRRARAQPRTFSSPQGLLAAKMRQVLSKKREPKHKNTKQEEEEQE